MKYRFGASTVLLLAAVAGSAMAQNQLRIEWSANVTEYRGQNNRRVPLICPPGEPSGDVYGTDTYTDDSSVCAAALHAGVINAGDGGPVTIVIAPGQNSYQGSNRNSVTSKSFGKWSGSFTFDRANADGQVEWKTQARGLELAKRPITVVCPPSGEFRTVYGTDTYTDDSSICAAAVHAGLITFGSGGRVTLEALGEQASYKASVRNGVTSREYASWPNSFRFAGAAIAVASQPTNSPTTPPDVAPTTAAPTTAAPTTAAPTQPVSSPTTSNPPSSASTPSSAPTTSTSGPLAPPSNVPTTSSTMSSNTAAKMGAAGVQPQTAPESGRTMVTGAATEVAALPAPAGLIAKNIGGGEVYLKWNPLPGAAFYHILYRKVGETQWATLTDVPGAQPPTAPEYQNDAKNVTLLPEGTLEFVVFGGRDADDLTGQRSVPIRVAIPRYAGRYRVTVNGFRVNRETIDAQLNYDGQHDEVYVRVGVREYDADGNAIGPERKAVTKTHGDINAARWKIPGTPAYRYYAGSATGMGGLRTGDGVPNMDKPWSSLPSSNEKFPLFVWEGYLREGDNTVAIMPVIYEDDENVLDLMPETQGFIDAGAWLGVRGYEMVPGIQSSAINVATGGISTAGALGTAGQATVRGAVRKSLVPLAKGKLKAFLERGTSVNIPNQFGGAAANTNTILKSKVALWTQRQQQLNQQTVNLLKNLTAAASLLANTQDRPIGMTGIQGGQIIFEPEIIKLTFETAEQFATTKENPNSDIPAGITTITYRDAVPGGNGDYTLYIEIKRLQ